MKAPGISVLPPALDQRLPLDLPNTPRIRILFQSSNSQMPARRPGGWKALSLLAALVLLILGAGYVATTPKLPTIEVASLPDYARYQWAGFHRTGQLQIPVEARVPLRGGWI